jgi:hypothetical protein
MTVTSFDNSRSTHGCTGVTVASFDTSRSTHGRIVRGQAGRQLVERHAYTGSLVEAA